MADCFYCGLKGPCTANNCPVERDAREDAPHTPFCLCNACIDARPLLPVGPALNVRREEPVTDPTHGGKVYPDLQPERYAEIIAGSYEAHMICEHCGNEHWRGCMADEVAKALEAGVGAVIPVPGCTSAEEFQERISNARKMVEVGRRGIDEKMEWSAVAKFNFGGKDEANPKDTLGASKPQMGLVPLVEAVARVMELGAKKYGAYNWRSKAVKKMVYVHAALRHLMAWVGGQSKDPESGESHLAHVAACMLIVLDAEAHGKAIDDREWVK